MSETASKQWKTRNFKSSQEDHDRIKAAMKAEHRTNFSEYVRSTMLRHADRVLGTDAPAEGQPIGGGSDAAL